MLFSAESIMSVACVHLIDALSINAIYVRQLSCTFGKMVSKG